MKYYDLRIKVVFIMTQVLTLSIINERSQQIIQHLLDDAATNVYTISKKGKKKLIYQTPWYEAENGKREPAGLVEFSIILPENMPHYDRG